MALLVRIYFNAVFGALGGLLGWMLYGVFGIRIQGNTLFERAGPTLLGGAIIGGIIGYFVVSVDAIRDRSLVRFARLSSYGLLLGAVGGALGMFVGGEIQFLLVGSTHGGQLALLGAVLARGLGWLLLGLTIGMSEGIAARSLGKFSYGGIGGALGGFLGGCLFGLFYEITRQLQTTTYFWGAIGLVILGACIGSLSALVQGVFQPASVKVLRGWQEGREYPLDKAATLLGRDEHADIALFRDMKVEKKHALITREGNRFVLVNNNAPPDQTQLNEVPVASARELRDGDRIQLGNILLRFQMRAAVLRTRPPRQPALATGVLAPPPVRR